MLILKVCFDSISVSRAATKDNEQEIRKQSRQRAHMEYGA